MIICNWLCEWNCNLKCTYCAVYNYDPNYEDYQNKKNNVEKAVKKIIDLNPDFIRISGGEPTLIKDFPKYLKILKEKTKAKICLNSNGIKLKVLKEIAPYLDNLQISYDGNGEINALTRGIKGDFILKSIKELYPLYKDKEFVISTVLTTKNISHLDEIGATLKKIGERLVWMIMPVEPVTSELSTIKSKEDIKKYNSLISRLKDKYVIYDLKIDRHLMRPYVRCSRGLNTYDIYPNGEVKRCWEKNRLEFGLKAMKKAKNHGEIKNFLKDNKDFIKQMVKPDCVICPNPCSCNIHLEEENIIPENVLAYERWENAKIPTTNNLKLNIIS